MNTSHKIHFSVWIFIFSVVIAILIAIFVRGRNEEPPIPLKDYTEDIQLLNDTIFRLKADIEYYEQRISEIELEKEELRRRMNEIIEANEETDSIIVNGDLDANVRFLTKYLSEGSDSGDGHVGVYNTGPTRSDKQSNK